MSAKLNCKRTLLDRESKFSRRVVDAETRTFSPFTEWNAVGLRGGEWGQATRLGVWQQLRSVLPDLLLFLTVSECETGIGVCLCLVLSFFFDTESHVAQGGLALLSPPLEQTPRWLAPPHPVRVGFLKLCAQCVESTSVCFNGLPRWVYSCLLRTQSSLKLLGSLELTS